MQWRTAALAACVAALAVTLPVRAGNPVLTLDDAFTRVIDQHPDLRVYGPRHDALAARVDEVSRHPAPELAMDVENAFGGGDMRGLRDAELTLSLAGVLERGGKLDARRTLAQNRVDALAVGREKKRLDLLADTARRYLAVVEAGASAVIARDDITARRRTFEAAGKRHRAGAVPESAVLSARAQLARSELALARAGQRRDAARRYLAALWGERNAVFEVAGINLLQLPDTVDFETLADWLERTPELLSFAGRRRVGEARLQLARSESSADVSWEVGVRRLQMAHDVGLVGSVSIALGSAQRARPGIRAARAELQALEIERESADMALLATLADAHGRYRGARLAVRRLGRDVIPRLEQAEAAAAQAWKAGAAGYVEWAQLQTEHVQARRQQLASAIAARRALVEIQRLTGQPFIEGTMP